MNNSMTLAKQALRKEFQSILNSIKADDRIIRSNLLIKKLIDTPQYIKSKRVAVYLSMSDEVDMSGLINHIFSNHKSCFIPQYEKDEMRMLELHSVSDLETLPKTKWNIKQPEIGDSNRKNALTSGGLDLVIVPGLAFTKSGKRLGRGKGYYDRFLKKAVDCSKQNNWPQPYFIALAFHEQIIDDIPTHDSDYIIDDVLIE